MIILTIDTDWAPDWATKAVLEKVKSLGLKVTVFFSTANPLSPWPLLECGVHPDLSLAQEAGAEEKMLTAFKEMEPQALALRTHRFFWHSDLPKKILQAGFTLDSSLTLPYHPHLEPFKVGKLWRFPVWSSDHLHLARKLPCQKLEMPNFNQPGLKIFCFHVAYLYLNCATLKDFNMIGEGLTNEEAAHVNKQTAGVWQLFELLAEKIYKENGTGFWLSDLLEK